LIKKEFPRNNILGLTQNKGQNYYVFENNILTPNTMNEENIQENQAILK